MPGFSPWRVFAVLLLLRFEVAHERPGRHETLYRTIYLDAVGSGVGGGENTPGLLYLKLYHKPPPVIKHRELSVLCPVAL